MSNRKRVSLAIGLFFAVPWAITGGLVVHSRWVLAVDSVNEDFKPLIRADLIRQ